MKKRIPLLQKFAEGFGLVVLEAVLAKISD